jgi:hypothetical protein
MVETVTTRRRRGTLLSLVNLQSTLVSAPFDPSGYSGVLIAPQAAPFKNSRAKLSVHALCKADGYKYDCAHIARSNQSVD